jgi:c-di-GMP-related signal transduction protein
VNLYRNKRPTGSNKKVSQFVAKGKKDADFHRTPCDQVLVKSTFGCADEGEVESVPDQEKPPGSALVGHRFVARQPIFDRDRKVVAYELLFRNGVDAFFNSSTELAARTILDSSLVLGLDTLCDGRLAYINCTDSVLFKELVGLLPPDQAVIEVLESVDPDDRIIGALQRLKQSGYTIALDDFAPDDRRIKLIPYANILKIDWRATSPEQRTAMVTQFSPGCQLLAEKVETQEEFREAYAIGFQYFQGYFFQRPELVAMRDIPANRLSLLRLLAIVSKTVLDLDDLEDAFRQDATICYRFLRYLNSPAFGFRNEIRSVRHALAILGEREIRRWVRLIVTLTATSDQSGELVVCALTRARFCEHMAEELHLKKDLFLLGLLSLMDAMLEIPMDKILDQLPIDQETKATLLSQPNRLRPLYQLILAQESGEWGQAGELVQGMGLKEERVADLWWQAVNWAQETSKHTVPPPPASKAATHR